MNFKAEKQIKIKKKEEEETLAKEKECVQKGLQSIKKEIPEHCGKELAQERKKSALETKKSR